MSILLGALLECRGMCLNGRSGNTRRGTRTIISSEWNFASSAVQPWALVQAAYGPIAIAEPAQLWNYPAQLFFAQAARSHAGTNI